MSSSASSTGRPTPTSGSAASTTATPLVLSVDGDLNELAAGFAREVKDMGGELMHFRGFLVVTPPGVTIDTDRLSE